MWRVGTQRERELGVEATAIKDGYELVLRSDAWWSLAPPTLEVRRARGDRPTSTRDPSSGEPPRAHLARVLVQPDASAGGCARVRAVLPTAARPTWVVPLDDGALAAAVAAEREPLAVLYQRAEDLRRVVPCSDRVTALLHAWPRVPERAVRDDELPYIARFEALRRVDLEHGTQATDAGLEAIARLEHVEELTLPSAVAGRGLAGLACAERLVRLCKNTLGGFTGQPPTAADTAALAACVSLEELSFAFNHPSERTTKRLGGLQRLASVSLGLTGMRRAPGFLSALPALRHAYVVFCDALVAADTRADVDADASFADALAHASRLERVYLSHTGAGDRTARALAALADGARASRLGRPADARREAAAR